MEEERIVALAAALKTAIEDQKEFKRIHKEIFKDNTRHNKMVSAAKKELSTFMEENGIDVYEYEGMEINLKKSIKDKHDTELLSEMFGDSDKLEEYLESVRAKEVNINTRKAKRARVDE